MLSDISLYEFTDAAAPVSGRQFGGSMCPRLEEREWLNELTRTAECRGGFSPRKKTAQYTVGLGSPDSVHRMCPEPTLAEDAVPRMSAVMTVPYYDISAYVAANVPTTHFSGLDQKVNWYGGSWTDPSTADFLALMESEGLKVTPSGMSWTAGMCPARTLADAVSPAIENLTRRFAGRLRRSYCAACNRFGDWFNAYSMAWSRDDGTAIGPDAETIGVPFLRYDPYGSSNRQATTYFRAEMPGTYADAWQNTYAYDGTFTYTIPSAPWLYSGGIRDRANSCAVQFLTLYRVMHCAMWRKWTTDPALDGWAQDKYYNVRYVICSSNNYALHTAFRNVDGNTILTVPASVKTLGDTVISQHGVASWPSYEPILAAGEYAASSASGFQAYVEPCLILATGDPAARDIGL